MYQSKGEEMYVTESNEAENQSVTSDNRVYTHSLCSGPKFEMKKQIKERGSCKAYVSQRRLYDKTSSHCTQSEQGKKKGKFSCSESKKDVE